MEWIILTIVVIVVILAIIFGKFTGMIAESKGYDAEPWMIAGVFLGPIAMLAVGLMDSEDDAYLRKQSMQKAKERKREARRIQQVEAAQRARQAQETKDSL